MKNMAAVDSGGREIRFFSRSLFSLAKRNKHLYPSIFYTVVVGPVLVGGIAYHNLSGPEICLDKRDQEPWQKWDNKQHKFISWIDHKNYKHPRPVF